MTVYDEDSHLDSSWGISIPVSQVSSFTLDVYPSFQQVSPGNSALYDSVEATSINNFSSPLVMSVEGLPDGAYATFSNLRSQYPCAWRTLVVTTSPSTPAGTYQLTVRGEGGGKQASGVCTLRVSGSVPAHSEWGLIILVVLILLSAWVVLRRRRAVLSHQ